VIVASSPVDEQAMTLTVAVVGLGAAGSATAAQLAERGVRVIGFDRFTPPHDQGSSHGRSRIIREAYFEHPLYVPLVQRAYALWDALEQRSRRTLFRRTGGLMMGPADGAVVAGALASAREHRLPYELLDAAQVSRRFPAFRIPADHVAVFEPRAGILDPESAIAEQLKVARAAGAELRLGTSVLAWRARPEGGVEIDTTAGTTRADRLVLATGAWTGPMLGELALPLVVERNVVHWFEALRPDDVTLARMPVFIHESSPGKAWYGFPDQGEGLKLALHHQGRPTTADSVSRDVAPEEVNAVRSLAKRFMPGVAGTHRSASVCLYTNTPDEHFLIDHHPSSQDVVVASPCSGHGFKFAPAIGELVADLVMDRTVRFDLTPFRIDRLLGR
jgi:sarcosine oxidase